jgi:hypothetical protein
MSMQAVVASSTGIVKTYDTSQRKVANMWGTASKEEEITAMTWADESQDKVRLGIHGSEITSY